jgi:hypothetical protein
MTDTRSAARMGWVMSKKTVDAIAKRETEKAKPAKQDATPKTKKA